MGKLIRNGIEYGGGNGTDIFEVTQAQYDALVQAGTLVHNALYVITDAPNLNPTASDIEYSSGVTVEQAIDTLNTTTTGTCTVNTTNCNSGNVSYAKSGNIVTVGGYVYTKGTWSSTATPIFELPYKPLIDLNPTAQTSIGGDNYKTTYLNVSSSFFNVRLDNSVENNQLLRFGFSYVANI